MCVHIHFLKRGLIAQNLVSIIHPEMGLEITHCGAKHGLVKVGLGLDESPGG